MKTLKTTLYYLKGFDILETLDSNELTELNELVKDEFYEKGETIYLPGERSNTLYFLKEGKVKLTSYSSEGKSFTVEIINRGEIFGEMSLVGEERRELEAQAMDTIRLCWIHKSQMLDFIKGHPQLSLSIAKLVGGRRREIENKLENLLFKDVPTRLALTLWELARDYGEDSGNGVSITEKFTHEDLANLVGSTRETVTKTLNEFQSRGLIEKGQGRITITNRKALKREARIS